MNEITIKYFQIESHAVPKGNSIQIYSIQKCHTLRITKIGMDRKLTIPSESKLNLLNLAKSKSTVSLEVSVFT